MAATAGADQQLFCRVAQVRREMRESPCRSALWCAALLGSLGLLARLFLLIQAGNLPIGPFSGVGDQVRYQTLADNLFEGRGFTYAGQPTALRPPLYPMFLAAMRFLFGSHRFLAARCFQFLAALAMAYLCLLLARRLFGIEAGVLAGSFALAMPTLAFSATELQAESLAACVTVLFLFSLVAALDGADVAPRWMGFASGVAAILRFNSLLLLFVGTTVCLRYRKSIKSVLIVWMAAGLLVAPWILRNAQAFHGRILFSSQGGVNLLQGVLSPDGRAQRDRPDRARAAVGWSHTDIETNSATRLRYPDEVALDQQALTAAIHAWKGLDGSALVALLGKKLLSFLFSTDQLLDTASFSPAQRLVRGAGVVCYWFVLVLAVLGWSRLLKLERPSALSLGFYVLVIILAHLPFVMNTRLRIPLLDPLLAVLAGGGLSFLFAKYKRQDLRTA
jgi:4-amino-4-deoxy-L-arabinose transferase-like glycosyltransferase